MNFQEFQKHLQDLAFIDLVDLYLEAKAGKYLCAHDILPVTTLEMIYELDSAIDEAIKEGLYHE